MNQIDSFILKEEAKTAKSMKGAKVVITLNVLLFILSMFIIAIGGSAIGGVIFSLTFIVIYSSISDQSKKKFDLIQTYKLYGVRLSGRSIVNIHELATLVMKPDDEVKKNIEEMIRLGYISRVVSDDQYERIAYIGYTGVQLQARPQKPLVAVTCSACGGITQIPAGTRGICDYCDSEIRS